MGPFSSIEGISALESHALASEDKEEEDHGNLPISSPHQFPIPTLLSPESSILAYSNIDFENGAVNYQRPEIFCVLFCFAYSENVLEVV